jgi:tRNA G10  N-methylase Trm11
MQIAILGRQPKISLAELESLFGAEKISVISESIAMVDVDSPLPQAKLGGTMKSARFLARLENTDLPDAFSHLQSSVFDLLSDLPNGKLQFGVSVYGFEAQTSWLLKQMLTLKKIIKKTGRSVRIIENKKPELESAQVLYNKLTGPLGWEILIIRDGPDVILAQTTGVQNIDDYSKRDFDRPKRDAYVGMLPPKLAQIMINLGTGPMIEERRLAKKTSESTDPQSSVSSLVLDPFCGTGVVLQEALLMGHAVYGTDLEPRMIEYSQANLDWLRNGYIPTIPSFLRRQESSRKNDVESDIQSDWILNQVQDDNPRLEQADATNHTWGFSDLQSSVSNLVIVGETYLGKPLTTLPEKQKLDQIVNEANDVAKGFLKNIASQLKPGTRLCLALPAWHKIRSQRSGNRWQEENQRRPQTSGIKPLTSDFRHLPVLDQLTDLGYNRLDLKNATKNDLIYHRPDQTVARELTILEKI